MEAIKQTNLPEPVREILQQAKASQGSIAKGVGSNADPVGVSIVLGDPLHAGIAAKTARTYCERIN